MKKIEVVRRERERMGEKKKEIFLHADHLRHRMRKCIFACGPLRGPHAKIGAFNYLLLLDLAFNYLPPLS